MASVQFTAIPDILEAYKEQDIAVFGIFHGKQLLAKYVGEDLSEGEEALSRVLERWKSSGGSAIYTLCLYEGEYEKINNRTAYDMSWNFQLNGGGAGIGRVGSAERGSSDYTDLAVECAMLRMENERLRAELEEDPEPDKIDPVVGAINQIMAIPGIDGLLGAIAARGADFISSIGKKDPPVVILDPSQPDAAHVRRVSGIPSVTAEHDRAFAAVDELLKVLPDAPDLLEKLVRLSSREPFKFKMFCAGLRAMKV